MRLIAADCVGSLPEALLQERLAMASSALGLDAKAAEALEKKVDPTAPNSKAASAARAGSSSSSSLSKAPIKNPIKAPTSKAARIARSHEITRDHTRRARRRESAAGAAAAAATATTATAAAAQDERQVATGTLKLVRNQPQSAAAQDDRHVATGTLKPVRIGGRQSAAALETARVAAGTSPLPQVETHDELR